MAESETQLRPAGGAAVWIGRILSVLLALLLLMGTVMSLTKNPQAMDGMKKYGYPENVMFPLGITEGVCAILYLIPRTSVLGAVLLTGYLGGATATHVRAGEHIFIVPIIVGILAWVFLLMRERRLRSMLPFRS